MGCLWARGGGFFKMNVVTAFHIINNKNTTFDYICELSNF